MTDIASFQMMMPGRHTGDAAISLVDFAHTFASRARSLDIPDIPPSAAENVWWWLSEMLDAAERERPADVARLARMVTDKVAQERQWYAEDFASAGRFRGKA
jgi:hypothetical protein